MDISCPHCRLEAHNIKLIPSQSESVIKPRAYLDENQEVVLELTNLKFCFKKNNGIKDVRYYFFPSHPIKVTGSADQKPTFNLAWEQLKLKIEGSFEKFLIETLKPFNLDDIYKHFHPVPLTVQVFDFTELDQLLELNGELTQLNNDKKFQELHDLLNSAAIKKVLLEYHPDKVKDNLEKLEVTKKITVLLQEAKKYAYQKIQMDK